jgi:hypothetical protein
MWRMNWEGKYRKRLWSTLRLYSKSLLKVNKKLLVWEKASTRAFQNLSVIIFEEKRKKIEKEYPIKTLEQKMILLHLLYSNVFAVHGRLFGNAIENRGRVKCISSSRNILSGFSLHYTISVHVVAY